MKVRRLALCIFFFALPTFGQTPAKVKSDEDQIRELMITMSRQLGVTCTTCHNTENFRSDQKIEFKVAKEHMKITQLLIDGGMDGKKGPKATCYMCHRGQLKPAYQEPASQLKK
ncbi:MAG: photosynthetic reaction center cytochrome c subunit family protein [Pseudobdellovibrionaceae bacterium]